MIISIHKSHNTLSYRFFSAFIAFTFIFSLVLPPGYAQVLPQTFLNLPAPGTMVTPSAAFTPALINGITIHPENPLEFDFIVGTGDDKLQGKAFEEESTKLIKYFLASLTVPEDEMWVNLSPYEKDRIIPSGFGTTEMGRDLLAQDYILKQLTASLMYPEKELGSEFWKKIYQKAREQYGTTEIPVNTFNKVWIVPEKAIVYEHGNSAFVVKSHLKVMLEEDYEAMGHKVTKSQDGDLVTGDVVTTEIIREVILPEIEREVNEGKSFANLRQIYNSAILAAWFKQNLRQTLLGQVYVDKTKTKGVDVEDKTVNEKIYARYLEAFKKGVYNYIKEDYDPATQEMIPRKYFSGGTNLKVGDLVETYRKGLSLTRPQQEVVGEYLAGLKDYNQGMVRVNLVELSEDMSVAEAWKLIQESQQHVSTPAEVEKVKEDVLAGIKESRRLLEKFSAEVDDGLVPSGINILKYTALLNALRAASLKEGGGKDTSIPAASLLDITERKNLGSRIQGMLATLNGNANTSKEDKQEITAALNSLEESLKKFKSFEGIIFQKANLDEQLKKVSHAFNLPEVNIFYALRNAVNKERLAQELSGVLGVTPGDELKERMTAADMIYRADDTYILWPDFLTFPKLKKITSGISKDLVGTVEKAILDSVDVNNFVAGLAWDSRKTEEEIVRFLEGQKRLSPLAGRWRAFHARESDPDALRGMVEKAKGFAGEFIKSHPAESGEFVWAVGVAPDEKSAVVTTAVQSPQGNNERGLRILLLDLSKGGAGVRVLHEASETQYNSPFNRIAFFDDGKAVTVWNLSRQIKWDIRDPENPRPIGWQEEETWAQGTSSSPVAEGLRDYLRERQAAGEIAAEEAERTVKGVNDWLTRQGYPKKLAAKLRQLIAAQNWAVITEGFYKVLPFGTAGKRGTQVDEQGDILPGSNYINDYTVAEYTLGLARYLLKTGQQDRGVVLGGDTRIKSILPYRGEDSYVELQAKILRKMGIKVYRFKEPRSIGHVAWTTVANDAASMEYNSASHNMWTDNGVKASNEFGAQLFADERAGILEEIRGVMPEDIADLNLDDFDLEGDRGQNPGMHVLLGSQEDQQRDPSIIDADTGYIEANRRYVEDIDVIREYSSQVHSFYTPIQGAGVYTIPNILTDGGDFEFQVVLSQEQRSQDTQGRFGTVEKPDPNYVNEKTGARTLDTALREAEEIEKNSGVKFDFVFGTDPDADRSSYAVRDREGKWKVLKANDVWSLFAWYRLTQLARQGKLKDGVWAIETWVTTDLIAEIVQDPQFNLKVLKPAVGFNKIAEVALREIVLPVLVKRHGGVDLKELQMSKVLTLAKLAGVFGVSSRKEMMEEINAILKEFLLFGAEESNGYSPGGHTLEKDGAVAAVTFHEIAAFIKYINHNKEAAGRGDPFLGSYFAAFAGKDLTINELLNRVYLQYGYYATENIPLTFDGLTGKAQKDQVLQKLAGLAAKAKEGKAVMLGDKWVQKAFSGKEQTSTENVQFDEVGYKFMLTEKDYIVTRPSGTEPYIRLYGQKYVPSVALNWNNIEAQKRKADDEITKTVLAVKKAYTHASSPAAASQIHNDEEEGFSPPAEDVGRNDVSPDASSPVGNYYEVLGVARDAAPEEIKTAYRELAKKLHPDTNMQIHPQMKKSLEEQFKEINLAHEILSDLEKRGDYDFILNDGTDHSNFTGQQGATFDIASRPSNDLRGKDMFERARRVERMREPEYIPILVDAFNNDTDIMVRERAANSLAHIGTREALFALTKLDIHSGSDVVIYMVNYLSSSVSERKNYLAIHSLADYAAKNSAVLLSIIKNKSQDAKNALTKSTDLSPRRARHIYETIKGILTHLGQTEDVGPLGIKKNNPEVVRITRQVLKRSLFNTDGSVNELIAEVLKALEPEDYENILDYYRWRLKNPADGVIRLSDAANLKRLTEPGRGGVSSSPVIGEGQGARVPSTSLGTPFGRKEQGITSDEIRNTSDAPGGIDLNPALLDLQIKRDGNGVPLPLPMQPIENMRIEGFLPIIINVTPVTNLPLLLGIVDDESPTDSADSELQPMELGFAVKEN